MKHITELVINCEINVNKNNSLETILSVFECVDKESIELKEINNFKNERAKDIYMLLSDHSLSFERLFVDVDIEENGDYILKVGTPINYSFSSEKNNVKLTLIKQIQGILAENIYELLTNKKDTRKKHAL